MSNSQNVKDPVREEILQGARQLFERFGFKKTTMEDIAKQIGKSKSSLYYYYKTKEEIFEAVVLEDMDKQRDVAIEAIKKEETAAGKFRVLFTTLLSGVKERGNRFSIFRADMYENPFFFAGIIRQRDSYIEEIIKDILILGVSKQEVKMMNSAEMNAWAKMTNLTIKSIGSKLFLEQDEDGFPEHQFVFLANSLFYGVKA
jgi:Transcriptional regulator